MNRSAKKLLGPESRFKNWGKLGDALMKAFPRCRTKDGHLDVERLTEILETSKEGAYKWLRDQSLPPRRAMSIAKVSRGRITLDELMPFVDLS